MRKVFVLFTLVLLFFHSQAQQGYFISIDADGNQPFSVMVGKKNYSSSSTGHLVIPNLRDSSYQLAFNFPNGSYAEHVFTIQIDKRDKGYQLKKNAEQGWSLQDWQTMVWIKSDNPARNSYTADFSSSEKSRDAFARMMAAVVNDSAVLFITPPKPPALVKKEDKPKDSAAAIAKANTPADSTTIKKQGDISQVTTPPTKEKTKDSTLAKQKTDSLIVVAKNNEAVSDSLASPSEKNAAEINKTDSSSLPAPVPQKQKEEKAGAPRTDSGSHTAAIVIRLGEKWTNNTRELTYTDAGDTVQVVIELDPKKLPDSSSSVSKGNPPTADTTINTADPVRIKPPVQKDSVTMAPKKEGATQAPDSALKKKPVLINSDCKNFATDADLDKLRIKMLAENSLDDRIQIARKVFKTKCFTARQIKALTELFVSDKTRYAFFDAAYPFVSDSENFKALVELLSDPYYVDRFKAMVRMQ